MLQDPDLITLQEVRTKVTNAYAAWQKYRHFQQSQIDHIVEAVATAARDNAQHLAELAVTETGYGNARDKLAKNLLAADLLPRTMRGMKTIGILREDPEKKVVEIGVPMGVIAAILPTTNPTSTAIYKVLICLKAGNGIVLSPHPRAKRCTCETAAILAAAAEQAGAPAGIIQCINAATIEATNELMRHKGTAAILSTGGSGIVKAAYSSGKPAFGVGPGNVPVVFEKTADIPDAVAKVVAGKSFDYGTLCSSEQAIVAESSLRESVLAALKSQKAFVCDDKQKQALAKLLLIPPMWSVNPQCVGQPAPKIAEMAGFTVPPDTSILVTEIDGVGKDHPLSAEKLSPVLSLFFVRDFAAALDVAESILRFGGAGHTCGIYSKDDARIREFALRMPAMRVLCNTPTPQGSVGITTNLFPAMTLGCGAVAGNSTGDNISPLNLINIKRLAYAVRKPEDAFEIPATTAKPRPALIPTTIDKPTLVAAVERYLAQRGVPISAQPSGPQPNTVVDIVDRFLQSKRSPSAPATATATCGGCAVPAPADSLPAAAPPVAEKPAVPIVDFVCEHDVRVAIQQSRKIYIGPKTIVTPSARDLAAQHETLVTAQRT
jgi:acetaldehyde dehydrogenase (acetylating)